MKFSYYFDGVRYTEVDVDFLRELTRGCKEQQYVINGILGSKKMFDDKNDGA